MIKAPNLNSKSMISDFGLVVVEQKKEDGAEKLVLQECYKMSSWKGRSDVEQLSLMDVYSPSKSN